MATFKYFCDAPDLVSDSVELNCITSLSNEEFAKQFPSIKGLRYDGYNKWVGRDPNDLARLLPVTRTIEYKSQPSLHDCNAKCLNGKITGVCECRCGGKNHGRCSFLATVARAGAPLF